MDVVVATPGRAVDHLKRGSLRLDEVRVVILDEADEMLDMGFAEDLETILSATPEGAPDRAVLGDDLADHHAHREEASARSGPDKVHAERATADGVARVRQVAYVVRRNDKLAALCRILDVEDPGSTLVFARTRGEVDDLAEALSARGHDAGALHGGLTQEARDRIMGRFRDGSLDVLVATDVAARGLDIEHVSHVVNFDVPSNPDAYVHRIGRTGRAGREGVAITLVEPREHRLLRNIEAATHTKLQIAHLPTVADLRERRTEILRGNLREALLGDGYDRFRGVVEPLSDEFDLVDIALAAVSLIEGAGGGEARRGRALVAAPGRRVPRPGRHAAPRLGAGPVPAVPGPAVVPPGCPIVAVPIAAWVRLFVGGGRKVGLRPGDLVGAITNEAHVPGSVVGAIQINEGFSLVDIAPGVADQVVDALREATIRGRRLQVRRDT